MMLSNYVTLRCVSKIPIVQAAAVSSSSRSGATVDSRSAHVLKLFKYLDTVSKRIDISMDKAIAGTVKLEKLQQAMKYCTRGGRHLSALCIASCELLGGTEEMAMPMACAVEFFMSMILTLDDLPCMDNASLRNGRPATHKVYGQATAVIATHEALCLTYDHFINTSNDMSAEKKLKIVNEISKATQKFLQGQLMDIEVKGGKDTVVTLETLNFIDSHKTSAFFELPLVTGGIIGGGSNEDIESLRRFGHIFGLMWQVNDDISDRTMTTKEMGKDAASDLRNQKQTHVDVLGMEKCKERVEELSQKAKAELAHFGAERAWKLIAVLEATKQFGSIYNNAQLLEKALQS